MAVLTPSVDMFNKKSRFPTVKGKISCLKTTYTVMLFKSGFCLKKVKNNLFLSEPNGNDRPEAIRKRKIYFFSSIYIGIRNL